MKLIVIPLLGLAAGACATGGPVETRSYSLSGFDSIEAGGGVNVVLRQGPFAISAEGPREKLDSLEIELEGSTLTIGREGRLISWWGYSERDVVTVTAPAFVNIEADGGADIDAENLRLADARISLNGGADFNLSGECNTLVADVNGGADLNARNFRCNSATVEANGGADVEIAVTGAAKGDANGGGDITFFGSPTTFEKHESGGGDVEMAR